MNRVVGALLLVVFIAAVARLVLASRAEGRASPVVLVVSEGVGEPTSAPRAVNAVIAQLDAVERKLLAEYLETAVSRYEARGNPFVSDLEDGDPDDATRAWATAHAPLLRAAAEVSRSKWCASDGLCVMAKERCPASARCVPVWGASNDPLAKRARFLAWSLTTAVWLRARNGGEQSELLSSLRLRSRDPASTFALALAPADESSLRDPNATTIRDAWIRWKAVSKLAGDAEVAKLRLREGATASPPPVPLEPYDVLLVPKLGAFARPEAFMAEVRAHVGRAQIVAAPAP